MKIVNYDRSNSNYLDNFNRNADHVSSIEIIATPSRLIDFAYSLIISLLMSVLIFVVYRYYCFWYINCPS